jgi:hypothetical protein
MTRKQKGRVAPAPQLRGTPQRVADAVATFENVSVQAHWEIGSQHEVNGTDFYVGEAELGHIHLDGEAHVPLGAVVAGAIVKAGLARRFRWSVAFAVVDGHDFDAAVWVFALRHRVLVGLSEHDALLSIEDRVAALGQPG